MNLNNKTIIVYCPILEFHSFIKCNLFLAELRKRYEHIRIICSIPEKALGTISEADELLVYSNKQLDRENVNLPEILDNMVNRDLSNRYKSTVDFVEKNYKDFILLNYDEVNMRHNSLTWFNRTDIMDSFRRDFGYLCSYLSDGNYLMPTTKAYENIKLKYKSIFNKKTYIIITRNFTNKQSYTNTLSIIPQLSELTSYLINNGIKIVNIGFPTEKLHGNHENYVELNESLTQDELMALFYLSNGVILSGENGGFTVHASTLNDIFIISEEWSKKYVDRVFSLEDSRNNNNSNMITYNLIDKIKNKQYDEILHLFLNHSKKLIQKFNENDINEIYIDEFLK